MKTKMEKMLNSIEKWIKKHDGNVAFIGSFVAFDDDSEIIEDRITGYGTKDVLKIMTDEHRKMLKADKEDFINW